MWGLGGIGGKVEAEVGVGVEVVYRLEGRCTRLVVRRLDSRVMRPWRRFLRRGIWGRGFLSSSV